MAQEHSTSYIWFALNNAGKTDMIRRATAEGVQINPYDVLLSQDPEVTRDNLVELFQGTANHLAANPPFLERIQRTSEDVEAIPPLVIFPSDVTVLTRTFEQVRVPATVLGCHPDTPHHHHYTRARRIAIVETNYVLRSWGKPLIENVPLWRSAIL